MNATESRIEKTIVTSHHVELLVRREGTDNANPPLRIEVHPTRDGITIRCFELSEYEVDKIITGTTAVQISLKDHSPKH